MNDTKMSDNTTIILAKAIKESWLNESTDYNRESSNFGCLFCDSDWTEEYFHCTDDKYRKEMIKGIKHEDNCPYVVAMGVLKEEINK